MIKIIEADQGKPYDLIKHRILNRNKYKELLEIVKKNQPNLSIEEIVVMFKELSETGCSVAMLANCIAYFFQNDDDFKNKFSYLIDGDVIDCNKIMVDIFSKFYNLAKVSIASYEQFKFENNEEAYKFFGGDSLEIFKKGYIFDGFDEKGNVIIKSRFPKVNKCVATPDQVAKKYFNLEGITSFEQLKQISKDVQITDLKIYQKLTGLLTDSFNFWCNYYFKDFNKTIVSKEIGIEDFKNDYNSFVEYVELLINNGYLINVSSRLKTDVYMHTQKKLSWTKISTDTVGHVMLFKGFDENGDIVVSSYGEDYIISKEFYSILEFEMMEKQNKIKENTLDDLLENSKKR